MTGAFVSAVVLIAGTGVLVVGLAALGQARNATLMSLPLNTWVKLEVGRNPIGRSFSGIAGAYGDGFVFYFGGGHGSHRGNDVELFDIHGNAWIRATEPEVPVPGSKAWEITGGWGTTELTPNGNPYTEHTYQLSCYDPDQRLFISALTSGTWSFEPRAHRWQRLTPARPESRGIETKMLVHDPGLGAVLFFATTSGHRGIYRFDYRTARWVRTGTVPPEINWSEIYSAYDARRRVHVISHRKTGLWTYEAARDAWQRVESTPPELTDVRSFAYDPESGVMLFAQASEGGERGGRTTLWTYTADPGQWARLEPRGPAPTGRSAAAWGTLVYVPEYRAFLFLNTVSAGGGGVGGTTETWAFRYAHERP